MASMRRAELRRVSALDLVDEHGRFKRPNDLPRKVRKECEHFSVDDDGRIRGFRFRNRYVKFRHSKKRKKTRITKAMDLELIRLLEQDLARLRTARAHGA